MMRTSPLRHGVFRWFYIGSIGAALGYTMQATMAAWLMATLTPSALMVALVQSASTGPSLLFGLFAGSLADIVDRRRVVLVTQIVLCVAAAMLGVAELAGVIGPVSLLVITFVIGAGFTVYLPAQQASVNDLVDRSDLPRAVALGAVAFNVARAVGPALAGAIAAWLGSGSAILSSAAFFLVMIVAISRWQHAAPVMPGVPETLLSGVRSGLRFARHSPLMRALLLRNVTFSLCASAVWALLPLVARDQLQMDAAGFGLLSAAFGIGAILGALTLPREIQRISLQKVVDSAAVLWVAASLLIALSTITSLAVVGMFAAGIAWVGVLASLSAGTQSAAPAWVRARALAMNLVANQTCLALGSALWGVLASTFSIRIALAASSASLVVLLFLHRRVRVRMGEESDVMPGAQLPDLGLTVPPRPDDGPVLIQIEYRIAAEARNAFLKAMREMERVRRRNGAYEWRVFRDLESDDRFVERYIIDSWAEYQRLRARMTIADRAVNQRVADLQRPGTEMRISRFINMDPRMVRESMHEPTLPHG
ncbi:MAG: MFS transporter [Casimicrobiaceae bacterium]